MSPTSKTNPLHLSVFILDPRCFRLGPPLFWLPPTGLFQPIAPSVPGRIDDSKWLETNPLQR